MSGKYSWISPALSLTSSNIEGSGYIAQRDIKKDEVLIVHSGVCVHVDEIDTMEKAPNWYVGFQVETDVYYFPHTENEQSVMEGIFCINHSCEPNAGFSGQITLVAMRNIAAGEEITYDYAMTDIETESEDPWDPEACLCGTANCRGAISGNDWQQPEIQTKYQGYFSEHVAKAINSL